MGNSSRLSSTIANSFQYKIMDSRQFKTQCPHCLETYLLSSHLIGRFVTCSNCGKSFKLIETTISNSKFSSTSTNATPTPNDSNYLELSQSIIDEFAQRFPKIPQGVWPVGETLLDGMCQVLPFSKDKLYAEGGVGLVQRVRRRDWNVDLIVKSPKPGVVLTEFGKESFERECQTWIELGLHANIVSCYFVRRIDGIPRLFAELAPDGTLNDWITDKRLYAGDKREALARILDASIQFAWGLEHAHQQGLLHLDVKPSNVMTAGSTIKVTDFGLSKFVSESAESRDFIANNCEGMTPSYCSPEQFQAFRLYRERKHRGADAVDLSTLTPMSKQSDVWSWAISILAMFHGRSPCKKGGQTAAKVFEVFLKSQSETPRPNMPQGMKDLLNWCFREKPEERPESMQVIADQIVQIYQDEIGEKFPRRQPQNTAQTAESFSNRAISLLDLGKTDEALELLNKAVKTSPNQPLIAFNQALALWRLGKTRDSQVIQHLQNLTQNRSNDPSSFYVFGLAHLERGNLKSCIEALKHGLDIAPHRKDLRHSLDEVNELLPFASQCVMQYTLHKKDENKTPSLYVEESGEFLLVQLSNGKIALLKTANGQTLTNFIPKSNKDNSAIFSAVSEDYKWNLSSTCPTEIIASKVALKDSRPSKSKRQYRFILQDWDKLKEQTIIPNTGNILSSEHLHNVEASLATLTFVPSPNGITIENNNGVKNQHIEENEQRLTSFAVSVDAKWLATGGDNSIIKIWDTTKNRCVRTFYAVGGVIEALWFDPKKNVIVSLAKGNILQIWSVTLICKFPKKIHAPHLLCLINSSEELQERQAQFETAYQDALLAVENNDLPKLFDIYSSVRRQEGWKNERSRFEPFLERRIPRSNLDDVEQIFQTQAHDDVISTIASSWDASFFVSAGKDRTIRLWSNVSTQDPNSQDNNVSFEKLNRRIAWKPALELDYHYDWVRSIALSPNNRFLISGGWDQTVVLWDLATSKRLRTLPEKVRNLTKLVFAPDGRTIATATANGAVTLWDLATNEALLRLNVGNGYTRALTFSRDGSFFVTATDDSIVRLWNGRSQLPMREIGGFSGTITTLDLTSDGNKLVVGCNNGKIYLVDLLNTTRDSYKELSGHLGEVNVVKLFPDGTWLVSSGKDKTIRFWNLSQCAEVHKITSVDGEFCDLALDFSGLTLIAGSETGVIRCWNLFWDYELGLRHSNSDITPLLRSLSAYYAMCLKLSKSATPPSDYYRLNASNYVKKYSDAGALTPDIIQKIYTEIAYRGFHDVSLDYVKKSVEELWKSDAIIIQ